MITLEEFKKRYSVELDGLLDDDVKYYYHIYLQDPFQFHSDMID